MDSFLLLRRLVAAIVFKGQTVSDYWWSRRTIFLTEKSDPKARSVAIIYCTRSISSVTSKKNNPSSVKEMARNIIALFGGKTSHFGPLRSDKSRRPKTCMYGHTYSKSMDQPGKVANPERGQHNSEK